MNFTEMAIAAIEENVENMTLEEELDNLLFFKTCVVSRNRDVLELKMRNTVKLREKTIKKHETKFFEMFPFYFVEPKLVCGLFFNIFRNWFASFTIILQILYDFSIRFGFLDPSSLISMWPNIKVKILNVLSKEEARDCTDLNFDSMTTSFLMLLRSLVTKKQFNSVMDQMIVFSDVR